MIISNGVHGACKCIKCKEYFNRVLSDKNAQLNRELIEKRVISNRASCKLQVLIQLLKDQRDVLLSIDCPETLLISKQLDYTVNELKEIDAWLKV